MFTTRQLLSGSHIIYFFRPLKTLFSGSPGVDWIRQMFWWRAILLKSLCHWTPGLLFWSKRKQKNSEEDPSPVCNWEFDRRWQVGCLQARVTCCNTRPTGRAAL